MSLIMQSGERFSPEKEGRETNIKELRTGQQLTQGEFAEIIGASREVVSKWEQGVSMPRTADLPRIADALGVSIDELVRGKEVEA